jgi:hypothetical protein
MKPGTDIKIIRQEPEAPLVTKAVPFDSYDPELYVRNHTTKKLLNWTLWEGLKYFFWTMGAAFIFYFFKTSIIIASPISGESTLLKSVCIAAAAFAVKAGMGDTVGAHLDPFRSIYSCLTWIITRGKKLAKAKTWAELLKIPVFVIAEFLGGICALVLLGLWTDSSIKTDCNDPPDPIPAVCSVYPVRNPAVSEVSLRWIEFLAAVVVYGSFIFGERRFGWNGWWRFANALTFAVGVFIVEAVWASASGGSFGFWYWSLTTWFAGIESSDDANYIWPGILGGIFVMVIDVLTIYAYKMLVEKRKSKNY